MATGTISRTAMDDTIYRQRFQGGNMSRTFRTLVLGMGFVGIAAASAIAASASTEPSVMVFDQPAKGNAVQVSYAHLPAKGFVAIYGAGADGKPSGAALGFAELPAGPHRDFSVQLSAAPKAGQRLWASIYRDADNKPGFDPKADASVWASGLPSENAFVIR
jgi:hypothetical protein